MPRTRAPEPDELNDHLMDQALLLLDSYRRLSGRDLLPAALDPRRAARELYHAPFAVLAHDAGADPVFTYANLTAQRLFEMSWRELVGLPSRYSAEPMLREERQQLLARVARNGYIADYRGIRISRTGRRFMIGNSTVWNLADDSGAVIGQAAVFAEWLPLGD